MALSVSSIVEGIDQSTETRIVDLFDDSFETPDDAAKAYSAALQAVNLVANARLTDLRRAFRQLR